MTTADNEQFLRCWYEVDFQHIGLDMENEDESVRSVFLIQMMLFVQPLHLFHQMLSLLIELNI